MKIVFFNSCKNWGGGEKWHFDLSTALVNRSHHISVFSDPQSKLYNKLLIHKLLPIGVSINSFSFLNIFLLIKLVKRFRLLEPDIIVMNLPSDIKTAGIAAKIAGVSNIVYRRGSAIPIKNSIVNRFLFKKIITNLLVNSNETARTVLLKNPKLFSKTKMRTVYNGIDIVEFENREFCQIYKKKDGEIVLGNLARLSYQKGQDYLITLAKKLKENGINFKLLIGGAGELEQELKTRVIKEGLSNEIDFIGFVENAKDFLSSIDIFLFPSIWEGFGYSIIEAKLMRKPIVGFNISSNPEVVQNGIDGILVDAFNEVDLYKATLKLIENKELRIRMGDKGIIDAKRKYDQQRVVVEVEEMFKSLVKST